MKAARLVVVIVLVLLATALMAVPAWADPGLIQFRGVISGYVEGEPAGPSGAPLPGGRWPMANVDGFDTALAVQTKGGDDFVSGWCHVDVDGGILQPGGALQYWGTWYSTDLDYWEGDDEGGWTGSFRALIQVRDGGWGNMQFSLDAVGYGALEGWTYTATSMWKDGGVTSAASGHLKPPKG